MQLTRYGITTIWEGDHYYDLPRWARDEKGLDYAGKHLIDCGGGNIFSLPISSEIDQIIIDVTHYMACDDIELAEGEEGLLKKALASDTPEALEKLAKIVHRDGTIEGQGSL